MRIHLLSLLVPAVLLANEGCKEVECGDGTLESDGSCIPANATVGNAKCGAFTKLVGDTCVAENEPTTCGPGTLREVNMQTGLGICKPAMGGGGCGAKIVCPNPTAGKQTVCGQLFDLANHEPFEEPNAEGTRCTAGATSGPCALGIRAYDALAFASNPQMAMPLMVEDVFIDTCGRFRLENITPPGSGLFGLGVDDANMAMMGPPGVTNITGVAAAARMDGSSVQGVEAFIASSATTTAWAMSGGPSIAGGIYTMVFRARRKGVALNAGVTMTLMGSPVPANDHYFGGGCTAQKPNVDPAAMATSGNGTALVTGASLGVGPNYSGTNGDLPAECRYPGVRGVSLPGIVFTQVLRPIDQTGMTCDR